MMTKVEYGVTKLKIERENEEKLRSYPILQKQLDIAKKYINEQAGKDKYADWILLKIQETTNENKD